MSPGDGARHGRRLSAPAGGGRLPPAGSRVHPFRGSRPWVRFPMPYVMDATERREILTRYLDHVRRFDEVAARRNRGNGAMAGEVVPLKSPPRRIEQQPTPRERQVLQLIADGLVNREIGVELHLSEETVKSHVRHLLAKLQARSRAHAVAVAFRRGLVE